MELPTHRKSEINIRCDVEGLTAKLRTFGKIDEYFTYVDINTSAKDRECIRNSLILPLKVQNKSVYNVLPPFTSSVPLFRLSETGITFYLSLKSVQTKTFISFVTEKAQPYC